jgi:hypothetical protein
MIFPNAEHTHMIALSLGTLADGLSLAMFEALRRLRDAVESGDDDTRVQPCVEGVWEQSRRIDRWLLLENNRSSTSPEALVLPGLPKRTRAEQMARIQELLDAHDAVGRELQDRQEQALVQRRACRQFLQRRTEGILHLVPDDDDKPVRRR